MSKKIKIFIAVLVVLIINGGAYVLLKSKKENEFIEKEISIKQAEVPTIETMIYKDSAGFSFEYPSLLSVTEVEFDDDSIYSSLELVDSSDKKLIVKVIDSVYDDTDEWQKVFEEKNVISEMKKVMLVDIPSIQFMFGAPILLKTVGVENKILYTIENPADNGGFFDQTHAQILETFKFDESVYGGNVNKTSGEDIILIEELLE
ncbi:MAG: hypothetical protein ABIJ43_01875 [Candidatus Beckwithbacteria bacterium]|nr:hypothetical protein [Patescibacteria group bacterium]